MMIAIGRRRLILSLVSAPQGLKRIDIPAAQDASDKELVRLVNMASNHEQRRHWESNAILYGGMRPR
jgi:hypothetical protein